ncbi:hypothetical protein RhiirA1_536646 [Rhizophagus irregularis]|uniref:AIG1-type G domain-containing protein n=1 Tax=Rhizophagus irregularis TaxID=588596 RepID=A0A2N0RP20_9GLOM|nr:hypothetical protein RhiirA1_536646 [Rhizophagus irregularis]
MITYDSKYHNDDDLDTKDYVTDDDLENQNELTVNDIPSRRDIGKLEDEINKLKVQNQTMEAELIQSQEQIKVITETNKKYHNQNFHMQEEMIKRQEKIKEKENEIATLQQNSQKLTKEKSELEDKLNKKISELEIELTKKEKIIEVDKKVIYKYENSNNLLQEQKEKLEDEISNLKDQNQIIKVDLIRIQERVKVNTEISQKKNSQLQEQIVKKQEIIKQKDNEITALQQSSQNLIKEKTELKLEITALQQSSQNLIKEKTELKVELTVKERIIEVANENLNNLQEEKGKLEDEINKLKEKNQTIEKDLIQVQEQIKSNIKINQKQNDQLLQEKIKQKENEIATLQQNSQNITKEKTRLEEELDKKISELEIELVKKEKIIETANKETAYYHERSNHLQEEKEELEDELETLEKELNHEIKALIKNKEEKQQKINELAEEMEKERLRLVKVEEELIKADEILKNTQIELELRQSSEERELIISKVKELKNNIKQLEIKNEESKQSLVNTQSKLSEIEAIPFITDKINKLTKNKIKQKKELEKLKEELKSNQEQLEYMEKKLNNKLKEMGQIGKFTINISSKNIAKLGELVKEKEELIEKNDKLKKNKLEKEEKIKKLMEKIQDEDWKKKCQGFQEIIDKKNQIIEEFTKKLPRKILLIGCTGSGKSTLANVLTSTNKFKESNYSISQTKTIQRCQFVEKEIIYEVIDTIGLNDTKLSREDILYKLAELARELKDGLHQILLVNNGRFTEEEIQVYKILETVLFDENVKNYTTIIRTNFEKFENEEECQNNQRLLIEEKSRIMAIIKNCNFFIHLDNPSNDISKRKKSKVILLNHLNKQIGVYRPSNLEKLNERIMDYMKNENRELVIQEMDKHVSKFEDKLSNLGQIGSFISGLAAVAAIIVPFVSCNIM